MNADSITVDVKVRMNVSREDAEGCLKIVEMYCRNIGGEIIGESQPDGTTKYSLCKR